MKHHSSFVLYFLVSLVISLFCVLFSVMFFTLLERKVLSLSQFRYGPNKVSLTGLLQPLLDGVKLVLKEFSFFKFQNKFIYSAGPFSFILLMVILWLSLPSWFNLFSFPMSMIFIMVCVGLSVYTSLISGWGSNSKFSIIGAIRAMAQTISYEISLATLIFCFLVSLSSMSLLVFIKMKPIFITLIFLPLVVVWFISLVAECNRAPFDFSEGESELVSGFNTEYSSSLFAFLFIGEYGMIIFFSLLSILILLPLSKVFFLFSGFLFLYMLLIRSVYPRFRYDKLMFLAWFKFLPITILVCLISILNMWV